MEYKNILRFNSSDMKDYFEHFDYLEKKYNPLIKDIPGELSPFVFKQFLKYERAKNHNLYNKIDYYAIKRNIDLIYSNKQEAEDFIFYYDFALSQLIDCFLNITSLDKLFSFHYFEFEWQQHIDFDFKKNNLSFYRDHFIHQIRNCYMILNLLDNSKTLGLDYLSLIKNNLKSRNTDLSKYINVQIEQYQSHIRSTLGNILNNDAIEGEFKNKLIEGKKIIIENATNFSWEYFVCGTLIIAALFHDICYPIVFMNKQMNRLNDYVSSVFSVDSVSFSKLNDLLENSLLFTTTNKEELKQRYQDNDHGAWSAYILLLQFYETGAIRELNPIKRAMIECAAVAIYEHTIKYKVSGERKFEREKPSFTLNPLSYTLRMVDDLQEWDRIYFEVRTNSDLRYCKKCKMPISRFWNYDIDKYCEELGLHDLLCGSAARRMYVCGCSTEYEGDDTKGFYCDKNEAKKSLLRRCGVSEENLAGALISKDLMKEYIHELIFDGGMFENGALFPYQKINYTVTSRSVSLIKASGEVYADLWKVYQFYIDYDPFRLLYLLSINYKALGYRINELAKLNKLFYNQADISFCVRSNLTDNPFMLKARVLCNFLYEVGHYINNKSSNTYKANQIYDQLFEEFDFNIFYRFATLMKERGLFVYDYSDEGIKKTISDDADIDKKLISMLDEVVDKFMNRTNKKSNIFIKNLKNTCKIYLLFLFNGLLKEDEVCNTKFRYIDDIHKKACSIVLADAIKQKNYLQSTKFNIYYEKRNSHELEDMGYALNILLDKKYYDPRIINRCKVNESKLDFFDFYSDLYLFKEMYRFSMDNLQRRTMS